MLPASCDPGYAALGPDAGRRRSSTSRPTPSATTRCPRIDLPDVVASNFPTAADFTRVQLQPGRPALAYSAIGQQDVAASALQKALVASGIADGGVVMTPHVMAEIRQTDNGQLVDHLPAQAVAPGRPPRPRRPRSPSYAGRGHRRHGHRPALPGPERGGQDRHRPDRRTNTSHTDDWMIGFAPANNPRVAVAVVVPYQAVSTSGAEVAGPIMNCMLTTALDLTDLEAVPTGCRPRRPGPPATHGVTATASPPPRPRPPATPGARRQAQRMKCWLRPVSSVTGCQRAQRRLWPAWSRSTTPRVFSGRYELTHLVARGGMAQVYRARDRLLDRPVALKVLFPELSVDRAFVERFRREAQAAANLSHPNIVPVFDWGEDDGTYFIVMEFVDGRAAVGDPADHRAPAPRPRRRHRRPRGRRPGLRPPPRGGPPRRQARQRAHHRGRPGQGDRLRDRPGRQHRGEPDPDRGGHGHGHLLLPRAGRGHGGRRPQRHLLARRRALRDGDRPAAVPGRHPGGRGLQARPRRARRCPGSSTRGPARPRGGDHEGHGQVARRPLPDGRRPAQPTCCASPRAGRCWPPTRRRPPSPWRRRPRRPGPWSARATQALPCRRRGDRSGPRRRPRSRGPARGTGGSS